ncbi:MAG: hypothetical protein RL757_2708 [Bacteroidota bacterium]|jgi:hypothetical protein
MGFILGGIIFSKKNQKKSKKNTTNIHKLLKKNYLYMEIFFLRNWIY